MSAWKALHERYGGASLGSKLRLQNTVFNVKLETIYDMRSHVPIFEAICTRLPTLEIKSDEPNKVVF